MATEQTATTEKASLKQLLEDYNECEKSVQTLNNILTTYLRYNPTDSPWINENTPDVYCQARTILLQRCQLFCRFPDECDCYHPKHHTCIPEKAIPPRSSTASTDVITSEAIVDDRSQPETFHIQRPEHFDESLNGKFCVVSYDEKPYPGIVQDINDTEIEVNVMHNIGPNRFFWPRMQGPLVLA